MQHKYRYISMQFGEYSAAKFSLETFQLLSGLSSVWLRLQSRKLTIICVGGQRINVQ